jgi:general secretion pathway protein A
LASFRDFETDVTQQARRKTQEGNESMYEAHWGLRKKPFENNMDVGFYYPSDSHQAALLKLRYVVENGRQGAVLTGLPGLGKSMIVRSLFSKLPETTTPRVHLVFPQMPPAELLAYLAYELTEGNPAGSGSVEESVRRIQQLLRKNAEAGRRALVVIDEAHLIRDDQTFEALRLLLNFETDNLNPLTLLFVGQPELLPALNRHPDLEERLAVKCLLCPLNLDETVAYISYRLQEAGSSQAIFTDQAMEVLHQLSRGIPRQLNRLCDLAMLIGYAEDQREIDGPAIEAVSQELVSVTPD